MRKLLPAFAVIFIALVPTTAVSQAHHCKDGNKCVSVKKKWKPCHSGYNGQRVVKCEIRRAAKHYHQRQGKALRVAFKESGFRPWVKGHHQGLYQFDWATWHGDPGCLNPYRHRSVYSAKWASLGAMWYWSVGHTWRWTTY